jgi:HAD domain in Swiss Army Knife RNA repair proteins
MSAKKYHRNEWNYVPLKYCHCRRFSASPDTAGESESAKLSNALARFHEISLAQLVQDHIDGHLDEKVRSAALA